MAFFEITFNLQHSGLASFLIQRSGLASFLFQRSVLFLLLIPT
jgi:hypothetical protein